MSVHELNQLMTYVVEGWMLFSAGFISTTFIAFVSRRIAEDMEAAGLTLEEVEAAAIAQPSKGIAISESESQTLAQSDEVIAQAAAAETIRLEEIAAVSEKLAKEKEKQSGSSVSVST
jgi:hypothetical protein